MKNHLTVIAFAACVFMAQAEPSSTEARDSDPAKPLTTPERKNDELLTATVTAIQGVDGKAETVIAYHNHGEKPVKGVVFCVKHLERESYATIERYGHKHFGVTDANEDATIMESGSGLADCVTSAPPSDVSNARVEIVEVFYTEGGSWKR